MTEAADQEPSPVEQRVIKKMEGGLFFAKRISGGSFNQGLSPMARPSKLKKVNSVMSLYMKKGIKDYSSMLPVID